MMELETEILRPFQNQWPRFEIPEFQRQTWVQGLKNFSVEQIRAAVAACLVNARIEPPKLKDLQASVKTVEMPEHREPHPTWNAATGQWLYICEKCEDTGVTPAVAHAHDGQYCVVRFCSCAWGQWLADEWNRKNLQYVGHDSVTTFSSWNDWRKAEGILRDENK
jgi:hypothetical protein